MQKNASRNLGVLHEYSSKLLANVWYLTDQLQVLVLVKLVTLQNVFFPSLVKGIEMTLLAKELHYFR